MNLMPMWGGMNNRRRMSRFFHRTGIDRVRDTWTEAEEAGSWLGNGVGSLIRRVQGTRGSRSDEICPIGVLIDENGRELGVLGILRQDFLKHLFISGRTGAGKSTLIERLILDVLDQSNIGLLIIDPKNDFSNTVLEHIPDELIDDVCIIDLDDIEKPVGVNLLSCPEQQYKYKVASDLLLIFKKIFTSWGPRLENLLRYCLLTLIDVPDATLLDINPLLTNEDFRRQCVKNITDPELLRFWNYEWEETPRATRKEATGPIFNKVNQLISVPVIRNIICQPGSIDFDQIVDEGKILIVKVAKGGIVGEDMAQFLGSVIVSKMQMAVIRKKRLDPRGRKNFYIFVDEVQNFVTESFSVFLSECRGYGGGLVVASQFIEQLTESMRLSLENNVAHKIECVNLSGKFMQSLDVMEGSESLTYYLKSLPPVGVGDPAKRKRIIQMSRDTYGTPRSAVEKFHAERYALYSTSSEQSDENRRAKSKKKRRRKPDSPDDVKFGI
ncbi:MAG: DUF87 domain-containing protein [Chloroflexota bacterium]